MPELNITLILGYNCNLRCSYCYEEYVNISKCSCTIDLNKLCFFLEDYIIKNKINLIRLEFYGGETFLYYESLVKIAKLVKYIADKYRITYVFGIMTNGTLISENQIKELKKLGLWNIQVTLDGDLSVHDVKRIFINGNGTFSTIINNIEKILQHISIVIRVNIDESNISGVNNLIEKLREKKFP